MKTHHLLLGTLTVAALALTVVGNAEAATQNLIPDILPVVWPIDASSSALNVTFTLRTACMDAGSCPGTAPNPTLTSGTSPIVYYSARSAGTVPINSVATNMVPCGSASGGSWWCANLTVQWSQAVNGPYIVYDVIVQWSTGVSPANTWSGANAVVQAREVRTTSSINEADLPEGRAHANATWESASHAATTYCILNNPCDNGGYESAAHANATWESQGHANATWCPTPCANNSGDFVGNPWFNGTFRPAATFGSVAMDSLTVGSASAGDVTISGAMTTQTALDPYVMPLVFGGLTVFSTAAGIWIARKPGIVGKLAIAILLVVATIWAGNAQVSNDANAFRWVAVLVTAGWALLVILSMKGQGVRQ